MDPRRILVAVTAGIAAYKVPELVRALKRAGHAVRCVMTAEARRWADDPAVGAALAAHNFQLGRRHFSYPVLAGLLARLLPA